jgi:hypothetical protein
MSKPGEPPTSLELVEIKGIEVVAALAHYGWEPHRRLRLHRPVGVGKCLDVHIEGRAGAEFACAVGVHDFLG